jgi:hypothetical protein
MCVDTYQAMGGTETAGASKHPGAGVQRREGREITGRGCKLGRYGSYERR